MTSAFAASAMSSLVSGVIDQVFRRGKEENEEEVTVSGVVDATLNRAAESARLLAEEAEQQLRAAATVQQQVSYSSMLYSKFHAWGGDGEGVYMGGHPGYLESGDATAQNAIDAGDSGGTSSSCSGIYDVEESWHERSPRGGRTLSRLTADGPSEARVAQIVLPV